MQEVNEACLAVHRMRVPVICRVDGYAVGAGMNLALADDFVIASDRARFAQIFVKRGLSVDFGGSWLLPRLVGLHRAKEMVLLGEMIDAAALHGLGIVRQVVPPEELDAAVAVLAEQLAAGPRWRSPSRSGCSTTPSRQLRGRAGGRGPRPGGEPRHGGRRGGRPPSSRSGAPCSADADPPPPNRS